MVDQLRIELKNLSLSRKDEEPAVMVKCSAALRINDIVDFSTVQHWLIIEAQTP